MRYTCCSLVASNISGLFLSIFIITSKSGRRNITSSKTGLHADYPCIGQGGVAVTKDQKKASVTNVEQIDHSIIVFSVGSLDFRKSNMISYVVLHRILSYMWYYCQSSKRGFQIRVDDCSQIPISYGFHGELPIYCQDCKGGFL